MTTTNMYLRVFKVHALQLSPSAVQPTKVQPSLFITGDLCQWRPLKAKAQCSEFKGLGVWGSGSEILIDRSILDTGSRQIDE